jgi:hypothetical protein
MEWLMCLPSKHKAQSSNPNTAKKTKHNKLIHILRCLVTSQAFLFSILVLILSCLVSNFHNWGLKVRLAVRTLHSWLTSPALGVLDEGPQPSSSLSSPSSFVLF